MRRVLACAALAGLTLGCQQRPADRAGAREKPPSVAAGEAAPADPATAISGQVVAAPALAAHAGGRPTLFLIARDPASGQIVAARKEEAVRLPFAFTISEADSMMRGGAGFAGALDLTARVSKTGDAMRAAGDVEGTAEGVRVGARDATITLDTVRP